MWWIRYKAKLLRFLPFVFDVPVVKYVLSVVADPQSMRRHVLEKIDLSSGNFLEKIDHARLKFSVLDHSVKLFELERPAS